MSKGNFRIITTKEAKIVLDKSIRQTRRLLNAVRTSVGKKLRCPVTVQEFCAYFNFKVEDVYAILGWNN